MTERDYWAWISGVDSLYWKKVKGLLKHFKTAREIYFADKKDLERKGGLSKEETDKIEISKKSFDAERFWKQLKDKNIHFVCIADENYPQRLRPYDHKPYFLFYKGNLPKDEVPSVAMVGARACSDYGRKMAKNIACCLAENNVQIISGMARGIDTYSQLGAIERKAPTYAVLGCGVDICYPAENIEIYETICHTGGILSEYPPGAKPLAWHFPQRNRIISGLSDKVVVVEAKEKSGSLITVEWALEQGKDIMAVPGRISESLSSGCNQLIKSGAEIITSPKDVLEDFKYEVFKETQTTLPEEKTLEKDFFMVYSELGLQPKNIYELMSVTGLEYGELTHILLQLQLRGFIEQTSENVYVRIN